MGVTLFGAALLALAQTPTPSELVVSADNGDDVRGDGSADAPLRSITRALALARERGGLVQVVVQSGTYGPATSERFPIALPSGASLRGFSPGQVVLDGGDAPVLFSLELSGSGTTRLAGMRLAHAGIGIAADLGTSGDGRATPRLELVDLLADALTAGLAVDTGEDAGKSALLLLRGVRCVGCDVGLEVQGQGRLALAIEDSLFERCRVGMLLEADPAEDPLDPRDEGGKRVAHELRLERTSFEGCREAGFRRQGHDGANGGGAYLFSECLFRGNGIGLELRKPCGDTPLVVRGSRFLSNDLFGIQAIGGRGDAAVVASIEDSEFRWNGVGINLTGTQVAYALRRNRVVENAGNGLFLANFLVAPTRILVESCLVARNGGLGILCLADNRELEVRLLHDTIVDNAGNGVFAKARHKGKAVLDLRGCIVAGNAGDLAGFDLAQVHESLIGDGAGAGERGNESGDPLFVDRALGDYALRPGSPAVDASGDEGREALGALDLLGNPRRHGPPDLGACELATEAGAR